ncbi:MAG TPA: UDP-N-acetylmuramoyl-L-alanyl-D-glutamate--2,6-diaminopimelate ligase [Myxococcota bacterium]|nr:UDP-N-acetylmuramoyl-L-alanyl-D-glutamate--2,6-diaminopimelate ligase [Myxococcota bacterium]
MRLSALLAALPPELAPNATVAGAEPDPVVRGIATDSREVSPGDVFFALRGTSVDGHDYLPQALALGASVVFVEALPPGLDLRGACAVVVPQARRALAPVAVRFFGAPAEELFLVGVTGTNGKTSTTYLVESILGAAGRKVGVIGTVEVRYAGERRRTPNTTPESLDLQRTLRDMRTRGVDACVMEVSSHGLELGRVDGCLYDVAAFTNLTQDHLDFHADMDRYREAKLRLFRDYLAPDAGAVVNLEDPSAEAFCEAARRRDARLVRVTRDASRDAEVRLASAEVSLTGTRARVLLPGGPVDLALPLVGDFNLENLLVACGVAQAAGVAPAAIAAGVAACPQVPGRVERVKWDGAGPTVFVDYAHTPDAVEKLLRALRPLCRGQLVAVFGCGGDRDAGKRPLMAHAVARYADRVIATSDNPRTEDPERILDQVEAGLTALPKLSPEALATTRGYARIADRRAAIEAAVRVAREGDTVVIAGKGHEDYQIVGRERLPFHDGEEARRALRRRAAA